MGRRHRRLILDYLAVAAFDDSAEVRFRRWLAEELLPSYTTGWDTTPWGRLPQEQGPVGGQESTDQDRDIEDCFRDVSGDPPRPQPLPRINSSLNGAEVALMLRHVVRAIGAHWPLRGHGGNRALLGKVRHLASDRTSCSRAAAN
jgi:hypothetical protein